MPRGDKPTTPALALKDGWIYEDALPTTITKEQYDWWFNESLVLNGVRMGPPLANQPTTTKEALEPCPFCGSRDLDLGNGYDEDANWVVICRACKSGGTFCAEKAKAVARWNSRVSASIVAPVVDQQWVKLLASAISTAEPTLMPERDNATHYVISREAFADLVQVHRAIAKHLWGTPAATVAPQQSDDDEQPAHDGFHCEQCEATFFTEPHATEDGYWLCGPCWKGLQSELRAHSCTRAFPCRYRDARQCARDTMLGSECPKVCECACHAPTSPAALRDEADRACPCLHGEPCQKRCTCANPHSSAGCWFCCTYGSQEQKRDRAATLRRMIVSGIERQRAATTPPSTLAKAATEKIAVNYDVHKDRCHSNERYPSPPCDCGAVEEITAIIERCLAGGEEDK